MGTQKRVRVMRQIFVVTLALFTGLFVMYMTYYYFIRVEINKTAAQRAQAAQKNMEDQTHSSNSLQDSYDEPAGKPQPRSLLIQSLYDYDSSNIENCANKDDFSCDKEFGCVSYQNDIESVLKDMKTEYVPLYHLIERDTGETMGMDSCFASQLRAGELSCME